MSYESAASSKGSWDLKNGAGIRHGPSGVGRDRMGGYGSGSEVSGLAASVPRGESPARSRESRSRFQPPQSAELPS
jgi:hypothetical protein